jgi:hypothetical protein
LRYDSDEPSPTDQVLGFIEHCLLVASGSDQANDGEDIEKALKLVGDAFWPDLANGAVTTYNVETTELIVETRTALYSILVRGVDR